MGNIRTEGLLPPSPRWRGAGGEEKHYIAMGNIRTVGLLPPLQGGEGPGVRRSTTSQGEVFELMNLLPPSPPWRGDGVRKSMGPRTKQDYGKHSVHHHPPPAPRHTLRRHLVPPRSVLSLLWEYTVSRNFLVRAVSFPGI